MNIDFPERLSKLIESLGIKKVEFASKIKVDQSYISQLVSGKRTPSDRTLADICREFNVSETWLRTGEGEMFIQLNEDQELLEVLADLQVDEDNPVRDLLIAYWRLNDEQKAAIKQMIKNLIDLKKEKTGQ